jgi:phosphatidylserine/phosphatidylglycerophosphate/cardiolipin synthase-like enzyme
LHALDADTLAGLVSPSLLGTSGVIPLSIVSVIPDIMRHYAKIIVRAEAEILLATNYWEDSVSSGFIADALRELSRRVEARGGEKVVMKLIYDRGNLKQAVKNRIPVKPVYWSRIGLPTEDEIPGVTLEVINYHRPLLGTFHAKYLVVDRRVACLNSNNVQDRPNVEMMIQLEGPVVDSIYDMALLSWSNAMNPPLPLLTRLSTYPDVYKFQKDNEDLRCALLASESHLFSEVTRRH